MKVGPISIEKEDGYQQWRVSLTVQHLSYYTRWYSSHVFTKQEAIEKFMQDTLSELWGRTVVPPLARSSDLHELFEQAKTALLFLDVSERGGEVKLKVKTKVKAGAYLWRD